MTPAGARRIGLDERTMAWLVAHGRLDGVELANEAVRRRLYDAHLAYLNERSTPMHAPTVRRITSIILAVAFAAPAVGAAATHPTPTRHHVRRTVPATLRCTMHPVLGIAIPC